MDVLSTKDGSAQAVAAAAAEAPDTRAGLERELDRLNLALAAHATASAQHLQWTLLSQAFLLTSYLIVLIGGWTLPLPGKRWLLAALAGYAVVSLVFGYLSQRGGRDRIGPLRQSRRLIEEALERVAGRPPVFSRNGAIARGVSDWATALMPVAALAGWLALVVYTLALPFPTDSRGGSEAKVSLRATAAAPPSVAARGRTAARKGEDAAPPAVAEPTPVAEETGLAALFRRAINPPPAAADAGEVVKP